MHRRPIQPVAGNRGCGARQTHTALGLLFILLTASYATARDAPQPVEIQDASVTIQRSDSAMNCPGQSEVVERVQRHLDEGGGTSGGELNVTATIDTEGDEWVAVIVVTGDREGQRILRAPGPDCDELAEALAVSLALILDGTMTESLEPIDSPGSVAGDPEPETPPDESIEADPEEGNPESKPPPSKPEPNPAEDPGKPPHPPSSRAARAFGDFALGGGLTYGVPGDFSGTATARLSLGYGRISGSIGGFWAPTETYPLGGGRVRVRLLGGTAQACVRLLGRIDTLRGDVCSVAAFGALRGKGEDYLPPSNALRPWWALGGGVGLRMPIVGPLGVGAESLILAPLGVERFSVEGLGVPFTSRSAAFFGLGELFVRFL